MSWYPGKNLGIKRKSATAPNTAPEETPKTQGWYPGKFAGRNDPAGKAVRREAREAAKRNEEAKANNEKNTEVISDGADSGLLSIRRGRTPNSPVGTVHIRLHGARYIEAAKPVVKFQVKEQSEIYTGDDYVLETAFLVDSPTSDIVITVFDKFSVSARNNVTFSVSQNGKDDNNGAMIGQVVIPLVSLLTTNGVAKPEPQWYEVLPPSRALMTFGQFRSEMPLVRTRIEPLGFLNISVGLHINANVPNVFVMYFLGEAEEQCSTQVSCYPSNDAEDSNVLGSDGPVSTFLNDLSRLRKLAFVLPFNIVDIGPGPIVVLCLVYGFACVSIRAWELPIYFFVLVAAVGLFASMAKSKNVVIWSDFSKDSATQAAEYSRGVSVNNKLGAVCPQQAQTREPSASTATPPAATHALLMEFVGVVDNFSAFVTHLERFSNLWNFVDSRISMLAYGILFAGCFMSSLVIAQLGLSVFLFILGSFILIASYLLNNAALTTRIDTIVDEVEENILREETEGEDTPTAVAAVTLKEVLITSWKRCQYVHHMLSVFWSRVPTRFTVEHRLIAARSCVVEDGREMMDAAQLAESNGTVSTEVNTGSKKLN